MTRSTVVAFLASVTSVAILAGTSTADEPTRPVGAVQANPVQQPADPAVDVELVGPGILRGRALAVGERREGVVVRLYGTPAGRPLAETGVDPAGRFEFRSVRSGVYRLELSTPLGSTSRTVRVWQPGTAPPGSADELSISAAVVRGRAPNTFPVLSLQQTGVVSGLTGGAIALPLIYSTTKRDNRVPASP